MDFYYKKITQSISQQYRWLCRLLLVLLANIVVSFASAQAPTLITKALSPVVQNVAYNQSFIVGGTPAPTAVSVAGLPAGLVAAHNGSGNVTIAGTSSANLGNFALTITATNNVGTSMLNMTLALKRWAAAPPLGIVSISGGYFHSCAVVDGGVQCWGGVNATSIGNNTVNAGSLTPISVIPAGSNATMVSAGAQHTCAVVAGGLKCWGRGNSGELGLNSVADALVPTDTIAANSGVTAVSAGPYFTCAIVNAGVKCWGSNGSGQLGSGSTTNALIPTETIAANSGVTAISAAQGGSHACAVVDGGVKCWGSNTSTVLGVNGPQSNVPIQTIPAMSGVTAIAAGAEHTCAVLAAGVKCWGSGTRGQLGNGFFNGVQFGNFGVPTTTVPATFVAGTAGATKIVAGFTFSCAEVAGGVKCWGTQEAGEHGNNSVIKNNLPVQTILGGSNVTALAAGGNHACAVEGANSAAKCWGANHRG